MYAEYRERKWMTNMSRYNKEYVDFKMLGWKNRPSKNNVILADGVYLSCDIKKTRINPSVLVISPEKEKADSGFMIPNIKQANANYFVFDHDRTVYDATREALENEGYEISLIDFSDPDDSDKINPLEFLIDPVDNEEYNQIVFFSNKLIENVKGEDRFMKDVERFLLLSILFYLLEEDLLKETNFEKLIEYASMDILDLERMIKGRPTTDDCISKKAFKRFAVSNDRKFLKTIQTNLMADLTIGDQDASKVLERTTIDLNHLSNEKKALFVITPKDEKYKKIQKLIMEQLTIKLSNDRNKSMARKAFFIRDVDLLMDHTIASLFIGGYKKDISVSLITNSLSCLDDKKNDCNVDLSFNVVVYMGVQDSYTEKFVKYMIQAPNDELIFEEDDRCYVKVRGLDPMKTKIYKD